jgi:hypothetical protein
VTGDAHPELLATRNAWKDSKIRVPWWELAEVLFWIAYRDLDLMAKMLATPDPAEERMVRYPLNAAEVYYYVMTTISPNYQRGDLLPSDSVDLVFNANVVNTEPFRALRVGLLTGSVISNGHLDNSPTRTAIDALQWESLAMLIAWPGDESSTVDAHTTTSGPRSTRQVRGNWIDLRFGRESVMNAFPAAAPARSSLGDGLIDTDATEVGGTHAPTRPIARRPAELEGWIKGLYDKTGERPTKAQAVAQAKLKRWSVGWVKSEYIKICNDLGIPKRHPGQRPTR